MVHISFHVCTSGEYDSSTRVPTIQNPDPDVFYLVPAEDGSSPDLFVEWIYTNNSWEMFGSATVDLSNYVTQTQYVDLKAIVDTKVTNVEGYRLMSEAEGEKLAALEESLVKSVDETNLEVSEAGKLSLKDLPISKVTNLDAILNQGQATDGGYFLITQTDKNKLNALVIGDNGLEISGTVNASNVKELDSWITQHKNLVDGLSENNFTDELKAKLEQAITEQYISATDDNFTVTSGTLSLKDLPISKVTNLQSLLDAKANQDEFITLVSRVSTNETDIKALYEYLTWGELT